MLVKRVALFTLGAVAVLGMLLVGCQINEYHVSGGSSVNLDNGSGSQDRGRNSPSTLTEPDVSVIP